MFWDLSRKGHRALEGNALLDSSGHECSLFTGTNRLQSLCHADQYAQAIAKLIACDNTGETIKLGRERICLG